MRFQPSGQATYGTASTGLTFVGGYAAPASGLDTDAMAILDVQRALYFLGRLEPAQMTQEYDAPTKAAVRAFKKDNRLPDNDTLDRGTYEALMVAAKTKRTDFAALYTPAEKIDAGGANQVGKSDKADSREMWKKVALWGGVGFVGIGTVVLLVRALGKEGK